MAIDAVAKMLNDLPQVFNAKVNPVIKALVTAWATSDQDILTQLDNTKAQLFVKTANGTYLDKLASAVGVSRPANTGINDTVFSQLIPNLSFKNKQIYKAFYDTMDVFWGPLYSRANITGTLSAPFNVTIGQTFSISVDGQMAQFITVKTGDVANNGAATAQEVIDFLNQINTITASLLLLNTGEQQINIRTNTPGLRGSLLVDDTNNLPGVGFPTALMTLTQQSQRVAAYQLNPGEVILEIPAFVPVTRDTLLGSHHFHADDTLASPVPSANGVWQGSFFYSTTQTPFVPTSKTAVLNQSISQGAFLNTLTVSSTAGLPTSGGSLVINFGQNAEEHGLKYFAVLNSQTIEIDASYFFQNDHSPGEVLNVLMPNTNSPYAPRVAGQDLAMYMPSEVDARTSVQTLLETIAAAGIVVKFIILLPHYDYIIASPFANTD
jgi:hypothetical protein